MREVLRQHQIIVIFNREANPGHLLLQVLQIIPMCRNALEDPWVEPSEDMFTRSVSPEQAPDKPSYIEIDFEKGDPVAIDGVMLSPATLLAQLNKVSQSLWGS